MYMFCTHFYTEYIYIYIYTHKRGNCLNTHIYRNIQYTGYRGHGKRIKNIEQNNMCCPA